MIKIYSFIYNGKNGMKNFYIYLFHEVSPFCCSLTQMISRFSLGVIKFLLHIHLSIDFSWREFLFSLSETLRQVGPEANNIYLHPLVGVDVCRAAGGGDAYQMTKHLPQSLFSVIKEFAFTKCSDH